MKSSGLGRSFFCLWICLFAVASGAALLSGDLARSETAPPETSLQGEPAKEIRPKVGFFLRWVGGRYGPVIRDDKAFRLPGTHISFGPYTYLVPWEEPQGEPRYGFVLDSGRFFYLDESCPPTGHSHYGLSGNYFIVDGSPYGSPVNGTVYLFRHDKDSMRLVDVIQETVHEIPFFDISSDYPGKPAYGGEHGDASKDAPVWVVDGKDRQGHPLIRLKMFRHLPVAPSDSEEFQVFHLYVKIVNGRLRVALDRDIYEPLFESLGEAGGPNAKSTEYYVSGFLSGKVSLARIKAELANNNGRQWIVDILMHVNKWDTALHFRYRRPLPRFFEYKFRGR